jgi:hypothetical protein
MGADLIGNDSNMYSNEVEPNETRFKYLNERQEELIVGRFRVMGQSEVDALLSSDKTMSKSVIRLDK